MIINKKLYRLTQDELISYMKEQLTFMGVKYQEVAGNIVSLNHYEAPCFVAHMDTVNDSDMKKPLVIIDNVMKRVGGILGADDRAGINIILNWCTDINFILTRDEEIGAVGARALTMNGIEKLLKEFSVPCCIELDRAGNSDILGDIHGYCCNDLQLQLEAVLDKYSSAIGVFTDIDEFIEFIPCCNLSVGYHKQHTNKEYLKIDQFKYINDKIPELAAIRGNFELPDMALAWGSYDTLDPYNQYYRDVDTSTTISGNSKYECALCGSKHDLKYVWAITGYLCDECREYLYTELSDIRDSECLECK